uniref:CUB domain-containing protein n=1 Tax=Lutzomyia longipalpis TaxID=7200 RepID=A0A1B0CN39_LUTLO
MAFHHIKELPRQVPRHRNRHISDVVAVLTTTLWATAALVTSAGGAGTAKPGQQGMGPVTQCAMSEHTCTNGKCVPLNKFCDNINDCGDSSDEPRFCTPCNRTYYGNLGLTYDLELHRPKEDRIPYICVLTFTAAGGIHGDIVQVTLESFTVGKFVSYTQNGCPDGYLQIAEANRQNVGGMWCGSSWGPQVFYSETRSLILTVKLFRLARDQSGYNFDFRIQFKVLSRESAVVRYGGAQLGGKLIQGTYCSRIFSSCDKKICRLQSPNFPGVYPRNLTCYYAIRQQEVPQGKHAMIVVRQPKGNLIWISTQTPVAITKKNDKEKFVPQIKTWQECDYVQDYITIYDGYTTRDPVILKFCGGGQSVPPSISSGPELLVEFTTSPFGTFINTPPNMNALNGFQLEIEVKFVDIKSPTYIENKRLCEFWIRGTGRGVLVNPQHSLAPNTTCLYHLQIEVKFVDIKSPTYIENKRLCEFWIRGTGRGVLVNPQHSLAPNTTCLYHLQYRSSLPNYPRRGDSMTSPLSRFKVWLSILKFDLAPKFGTLDDTAGGAVQMQQQQSEDCAGMLRIWDGPLRESPNCKDVNCERDTALKSGVLTKYGQNYTNLIARFCRGTVPRSCEHGLLMIQPFVHASSEFVTLELRNTESTALRPLNFRLKYEFVDLQQDGMPTGADTDCNRRFVSSMMDRRDPGVFRSVRNVFLFGRGGSRSFRCVHRFEAQRGERVRVIIRKVMTGNRTCASRLDNDINRSYCFGDTSIKLEIYEKPWHDVVAFPRGCVCNSTNISDTYLPIIYTSTSRDLEIRFTAINMTSFDDASVINFEGSFEFIKSPSSCRDSRRKFGPSGHVDMTFGVLECRSRPWLIEPSADHFLYVQTHGIFIRRYDPQVYQSVNTSMKTSATHKCTTKSRVILTTGEGVSVTACPLDSDSSRRHTIEVFSSGWNRDFSYLATDPPRVVSVEFLEAEDGDFAFSWLEMSKRPPQGLIDCQYRCPELEACVNASVWCDGKSDCPSGYDESFTHCSALLRLPAEILATLSVVFLVFFGAFAAYVYRKIKRTCRGSSVLQTRLKSLSSMDTAVFDEKDQIS